jgi:mono/diheme cytochrome c family protein
VDEQEKKEIIEAYEQAKKKGVPFFPDALFKDAVAALVVFLILIALAFFFGTPLEVQADPSDTTYTPRPEWYFLFLFQLLKYFPGRLEVVGVFVLPTLAILALLALPFLDRSKKRYFTGRLWVTGGTAVMVLGAGFLTVQALLERAPPAEIAPGDQTAALYTANCATCHGSIVIVPEGTNLHQVIAQGKHEDMPAWSGDLTSDEIDALAGFILSPAGSLLFVQNCGECHLAPELVAGDPLGLKRSLDMGSSYPSHQGLGIPEWSQVISPESRTALLNFLVAPDGQRLFSTNCAACHGRSVAVRGQEEELRTLISQGGLHLEMPPWRERLTDAELDSLALYVVDPDLASDASPLYDQHCSACHAQRVPSARAVDQARQIIAAGGAHETMPVWGEVLTDEQLDALVSYTIQAATGSTLESGQLLFAQNCSTCHGDFGEGGPNPGRPHDIIAPISSAEYLQTRDDSTLQAIIAAGQPNFGMSPFGTSFGGPLDSEDIGDIVAFIRSWETDPPVEFPPEVDARPLSIKGDQIYAEVCSQCHGEQGEGLIGPSLQDDEFQARFTDQSLFDSINMGHKATAMIAWGEILSAEQVNQLVDFIRQLAVSEETGTLGPPSFAGDVMPIFQTECALCHGTLGGWDASSYESVIGSGDHAPIIIPGDAESSLLVQKMIGTHEEGAIMPPSGQLLESQIQIILDWITAGAEDN